MKAGLQAEYQMLFQTFAFNCYFSFFIFFFFIKKCFSFFQTPNYVNLVLQLVSCVDGVRKPMYYSRQPTTTCSDHSQHKPDRVPRVCFSNVEAVSLSFPCNFFEIASNVASLVWYMFVEWNGQVQEDKKGMCLTSGSCLAFPSGYSLILLGKKKRDRVRGREGKKSLFLIFNSAI